MQEVLQNSFSKYCELKKESSEKASFLFYSNFSRRDSPRIRGLKTWSCYVSNSNDCTEYRQMDRRVRHGYASSCSRFALSFVNSNLVTSVTQ